ncbi:MAG: hypothetical protein QF415_06695 [Candidatus Undinarchaeales archaeon]|jgi:hypothetical protein|nr:hypothetical protein [Candidatus Undinarchaeales archaeon]MDP7492668.1 hypothetical protein [Candidatus Undinarchaeales archaeon]
MDALDLESEGYAATESADGYRQTNDLSSYSVASGVAMAGLIIGLGVLAEEAEARDWRNYDVGQDDNGNLPNQPQEPHYQPQPETNHVQEHVHQQPNINYTQDSDGDGLSDYREVHTYGTNPRMFDTDRDGINDGSEVNFYRSNPLSNDTDGDGLWDGKEVYHGTNLTDWDTDNDGWSDGDEVRYGTNPRNSRSQPRGNNRPHWRDRNRGWRDHNGRYRQPHYPHHNGGGRLIIRLPRLNFTIR